jgi:nucleoside-diphosphate-sugar epimerase
VRVLLTGATGFIGSHVLETLLERGDTVRVLALPETLKQLRQRDGLTVVTGSLADPEAVSEATRGARVVYHLGGLIPGTHARAEDFQRVNVSGTKHLLAASVAHRVRRFVFASSTSVYGWSPARAWPINEEFPRRAHGMNGLKQYAQSKIDAENLVLRYHREHHLEHVTLRASSTYGAGIPWVEQLVQQIMLRPAREFFGGVRLDGLQWVHVRDLTEAVLLAGTRRQAANSVFNIAGGELFSFEDLCQVIWKMTGRASRHAGAQRARDGAEHLLRYDFSRAQAQLGYVPRTMLEEGLREVVATMPRH